MSKLENDFTIYVRANGDTTTSLIDTGDGIFSSISPLALKENGIINVSVSANFGEQRGMIIRFTNNGIDTDFSITQLGLFTGSLTADNTVVTVDNNIITADIT